MAAIVYLVNDLLFTSKIRETAQRLGLDAEAVRQLEAIPHATTGARFFIVDLRRPDALSALAAVTPGTKTIGFVDHERTDVIEAARARGCLALAKGKFSSELPRLLSAP